MYLRIKEAESPVLEKLFYMRNWRENINLKENQCCN